MSNGPDWTNVGATLGQDFHITRLTFKNRIGCGHTFAAIDGALELRQRHNLQAEQIKSVRVATYRPTLDIACYTRPSTANEARFSLTYVVATALSHGSVRLAEYEPDRLDDVGTRALMERMTVEVDPALDAAFPGQRAARIEIETADGRRLTHFQPNRKGDPEQALTDADLEGKFLELAEPVIGTNQARTLLTNVWALDSRSTLL